MTSAWNAACEMVVREALWIRAELQLFTEPINCSFQIPCALGGRSFDPVLGRNPVVKGPSDYALPFQRRQDLSSTQPLFRTVSEAATRSATH